MQENRQRISVVIPTYNRRELLERALESVAQQTLQPDEVIVVDDGSTDGTEKWMRETYPKIKVVCQANQGVSAARNAGIAASRFEWIAFLDSDDVWLPRKLERQMSVLASEPLYRVIHTEEKWIYKGKERSVASAYRKRGGWIFDACLPACAISPSTAMIHRSVFEEVGCFDERLPACEDYDLWLRICSRYPVLLVDEALIEKHGGHGDQLSNQRGLDRWRIEALDKLLRREDLDAAKRRAAVAMFREKCSIYAEGAAKRGRTEEAARYRRWGQDGV